MTDDRLPAHLEVAGLIRRVNGDGGFATVLARGEKDAGTILLVLCNNGGEARLYERMPNADGSRRWTCSRRQNADNPSEFTQYLDRRRQQDGDIWIVELDAADAERFIGAPNPQG